MTNKSQYYVFMTKIIRYPAPGDIKKSLSHIFGDYLLIVIKGGKRTAPILKVV